MLIEVDELLKLILNSTLFLPVNLTTHCAHYIPIIRQKTISPPELRKI